MLAKFTLTSGSAGDALAAEVHNLTATPAPGLVTSYGHGRDGRLHDLDSFMGPRRLDPEPNGHDDTS